MNKKEQIMKLSMENTFNGVLIVDKPEGLTSRDVVNRVSKILGTKKVGHTGTLDPLATGVLVVTVGKCTKLCDVLTSEYKEYIASFKLGFETDTLDITGTTIKTSNKEINEYDLIEIINSFKGKYMQEVPAFSAVKVDGVRLYEYARKNEMIDLPKREVEVTDLEIINIDKDTVTIKCLVSKGTYIRSLIRDIGEKTSTYATMTSLRRTKQGKFSIEDAISLSDIDNRNYKILDLEEILTDYKVIDMDEELLKKVTNGVKLELKYSERFLIFKYNSDVIALYKKNDNLYEMLIKF